MDTDTITYADRIRSAYRQLTTTPGQWISLGDLRDQVGGHREHVDQALRHMSRTQQADLVARADQRNLTDWDRASALELGGSPQHMISIR